MSRGIALTLSVLAVLNYIGAVSIINSPDDERSYFFGRKWSLDMNTRETTSAIFAIRRWQTVNTSEYLFQFPPDYFLFIGLAIAPLVIMYLCYRCGLVRGDQIAKSKSPSLSRNSP